jgi:hypothetical protein
MAIAWMIQSISDPATGTGSSTGLYAKDRGKLVGQGNSWNYLAVSDFSKSRQ